MSEKNKLKELIKNILSEYIEDKIEVLDKKKIDYILFLKSSNSFNSFNMKVEKKIKDYDYDYDNIRFFEIKNKCESKLGLLESTINVYGVHDFKELKKEVLSEIKEDDDYLYFINNNLKLIEKKELKKEYKIFQPLKEQYINNFNNFQKEDHIFKLKITITGFYYYTNNTEEVYFVSGENNFKVVGKNIEYFLKYNSEDRFIMELV